MAFSVSKLAAAAGLSPAAVRYYERLGLLPEPDRSPAGYRMYDEGLAERIRFIKGGQRLGLTLGQIRQLLDVRDRGLCPCGHARSLLASRVADVDRELTRLNEIRRELLRIMDETPTSEECPPETGPEGWTSEGEFIQLGLRK